MADILQEYLDHTKTEAYLRGVQIQKTLISWIQIVSIMDGFPYKTGDWVSVSLGYDDILGHVAYLKYSNTDGSWCKSDDEDPVEVPLSFFDQDMRVLCERNLEMKAAREEAKRKEVERLREEEERRREEAERALYERLKAKYDGRP
jgi:hypothetical protein